MKRHPIDPLSLIFGVLFAIVGGLFLFPDTELSDIHVRWFWPIPLIVLGSVIILMSVRDEQARRRTAEPLPEGEDEGS